MSGYVLTEYRLRETELKFEGQMRLRQENIEVRGCEWVMYLASWVHSVG